MIAPLKKVNIKSKKLYEKYPWIDNELNEIKGLRDYYYTRNRKNPNDIDYESYKLYRNLGEVRIRIFWININFIT